MAQDWVDWLTRAMGRGGSRRAVLAAALGTAAGMRGRQAAGVTTGPAWSWGIPGAGCGGLGGLVCPDSDPCLVDPTVCAPSTGGAECGGSCGPIGTTGSDALDQGEACGHTHCQPDEVCCNDSCGICTPPGGLCPMIACVPAEQPPF
jgi:hypothetical protein